MPSGAQSAASSREVERPAECARRRSASASSRGSAPSGKAVRNAPSAIVGRANGSPSTTDQAAAASPGRPVEPRVHAGAERGERDSERAREGRERRRACREQHAGAAATAARRRAPRARPRRPTAASGRRSALLARLLLRHQAARREHERAGQEPERDRQGADPSSAFESLARYTTTNAAAARPAARSSAATASAARADPAGSDGPGRAAGGAATDRGQQHDAGQDRRIRRSRRLIARAPRSRARRAAADARDEPGDQALGDRPDVAEPEAALVRRVLRVCT